MSHLSTFSIVAFDPKTKDLGVAVESKFLSVGAIVPWAQAGVGAIATQSWANTSYGPRGLRMLKRGLTPKQVGTKLIAADKNAAQRRGYYAGALSGDWDAATRKAFREFAGVENVEDRLLEGAFIDRVMLEFLRASHLKSS